MSKQMDFITATRNDYMLTLAFWPCRGICIAINLKCMTAYKKIKKNLMGED